VSDPCQVWDLPTRALGRRVQVHERVGSTNSLAAAWASDPGNHGLAFLADEQTAGRGQHGRSWQAAPRSGVLLSVLLFPLPTLRRPVVLTAWAAVSVAALARELGGTPSIKWPNDVLLGGKKVCGILIEQGQRGEVLHTVAGIGLNVAQAADEFAAAGLPEATSLRAAGLANLDTHTVARRLLLRLDEEYQRLLDGDLPGLEARWAEGLGLLGQRVRAECADGVRVGLLTGLSFTAVDLEGPTQRERLRPEAILHLERAEPVR
jgi:BirA family biotin operon repressor/biotin-[acetyl-CoA-carboxylase] ligase